MDFHTHAPPLLSGIYAIVNEGAPDPIELTQAILTGGARIVQYRAKAGIVPAHVRALRGLANRHGALLIVNDDWRAALAYGADGVHLRPDDAQTSELARIRAAMGDRIVGISCGTPAEARAAQTAGADYIGVGSVYATSSKGDAGTPIGIEGLQQIARAVRIPVAAIGGITLQSIAQVRGCGVAMAAVISAICGAPDPARATAQLVHAWARR